MRSITIKPINLPKKLNEGEEINENYDCVDRLYVNIEKVYVVDTKNNEWKIDKKNIKSLVKQIQGLKELKSSNITG